MRLYNAINGGKIKQFKVHEWYFKHLTTKNDLFYFLSKIKKQ